MSSDNSSVIKHKLGCSSVNETVVCGFQAYSQVSDGVIFSKDNVNQRIIITVQN